MSVSGKLGARAKLYYNTNTFATPTWSELTLVSDLTLGVDTAKLDASVRGSLGKLYLPGQIDIGVTFKQRRYRTDTGCGALLDAVPNQTLLDFMVLDDKKDTNGAEGWRFESYVYGAKADQGLGAVIFDELMICPAPTSNGPPAKAVVSTGAPVFTQLTT